MAGAHYMHVQSSIPVGFITVLPSHSNEFITLPLFNVAEPVSKQTVSSGGVVWVTKVDLNK
jgi:hypothetical protein